MDASLCASSMLVPFLLPLGKARRASEGDVARLRLVQTFAGTRTANGTRPSNRTARSSIAFPSMTASRVGTMLIVSAARCRSSMDPLSGHRYSILLTTPGFLFRSTPIERCPPLELPLRVDLFDVGGRKKSDFEVEEDGIVMAMVGLVLAGRTASRDGDERSARLHPDLHRRSWCSAQAFGSMTRARQSASIQRCSCCRAATRVVVSGLPPPGHESMVGVSRAVVVVLVISLV